MKLKISDHGRRLLGYNTPLNFLAKKLPPARIVTLQKLCNKLVCLMFLGTNINIDKKESTTTSTIKIYDKEMFATVTYKCKSKMSQFSS